LILNEVRAWRFSEPNRKGRPVNAMAKLPIRIR